MQAVHQALMRPGALSPELLVARLQEWQQLVAELAAEASEAGLATLYEVSQVLNSSLDLAETLNLVMDSLIHLAGAERGCLMLFDEEGSLKIRAARSFDRDTAAPHDLELSQTVVESAVRSGRPVVTTNAQLDPRFSARESVIGYHLRSIACVPLHVRERVTGALYLDNRVKEGVFSEADLPMLNAFANQAAVAIENARLYTVTDQALAARVEELTTLQQIYRELNASLDIEQVSELALSWALRATRAEDGMLCVLEGEEATNVVTSPGLGGIFAELEPEVVKLVVRTREPIAVGRLRILVPIRYEDQAIGLIDLRSDGDLTFRPEHAQFASRLADHAAVAIENARLYEKVRQANRAKSEFVSFVAHELRTPMNSIKGYAEMLGRGKVGSLTTEQQKFVDTICGDVVRMQILVADLQDVSRIETGQMRLEVQSISFASALEDALQSTRGQIEDRSQELAVDQPEHLPLVRADPARLTQIMINLLDNACKYTSEGGHVGVRVRLNDGYVQCAVSDTGVGISPEDQAMLFTKFFRAADEAVRDMPGTGLGLCIVKNLVELQGGEIEVESQVGQGTTFTFTVPVAAEQE
jgi:signal transduction histidine kinase